MNIIGLEIILFFFALFISGETEDELLLISGSNFVDLIIAVFLYCPVGKTFAFTINSGSSIATLNVPIVQIPLTYVPKLGVIV